MGDTLCIVSAMETINTPTGSTAHQPPMGAGVGIPSNAADGAAAANHFPGNHLLANKAPNGAAGTPVDRATLFGPLTTHRMEGAGGPFNRWDSDIAAAHRRGNPEMAKRLQEARARVNIAFGWLEPVWVPSDSQRGMLALRVGNTGLRTLRAA